MTLSDLRKFSIRKQFRVRFRLQNGLECVISERGIAQVPELKTVPDFNLEQELISAKEFVLEPVPVPGEKNPPKARSIGRTELESLASVSPSAATAAGEHDDE